MNDIERFELLLKQEGLKQAIIRHAYAILDGFALPDETERNVEAISKANDELKEIQRKLIGE